jgi:V/A-type H+-transporting ATPase subunit D|uniref:V-type ATP synthase subunit D n=1 Tax=candidate division WOR-3 bacterium TaxID=2052148 RepID=A0A7V3VV50_UNCW3
MRLDIPPTRMQLLRLKRRNIIAQRGHKLLKDKQDELIRKIMELVRQIQDLRLNIQKELESAYSYFYFASSKQLPNTTEEALLGSDKRIEIEYTTERIFNVRIPKFIKKISGTMLSYGFLNTSGDLDLALKKIEGLLEGLLKIAELEKALEILAIEIEKTRRRVNALEFILIPSIEETIKYINLKLSEIERSDLTRLMRIKEILGRR